MRAAVGSTRRSSPACLDRFRAASSRATVRRIVLAEIEPGCAALRERLPPVGRCKMAPTDCGGRRRLPRAREWGCAWRFRDHAVHLSGNPQTPPTIHFSLRKQPTESAAASLMAAPMRPGTRPGSGVAAEAAADGSGSGCGGGVGGVRFVQVRTRWRAPPRPSTSHASPLDRARPPSPLPRRLAPSSSAQEEPRPERARRAPRRAAVARFPLETVLCTPPTACSWTQRGYRGASPDRPRPTSSPRRRPSSRLWSGSPSRRGLGLRGSTSRSRRSCARSFLQTPIPASTASRFGDLLPLPRGAWSARGGANYASWIAEPRLDARRRWRRPFEDEPGGRMSLFHRLDAPSSRPSSPAKSGRFDLSRSPTTGSARIPGISRRGLGSSPEGVHLGGNQDGDDPALAAGLPREYAQVGARPTGAGDPGGLDRAELAPAAPVRAGPATATATPGSAPRDLRPARSALSPGGYGGQILLACRTSISSSR